jgi:hypothetical protein
MKKWQTLLTVVAFAYLGLAATAQQQQPTTPDHMQHRFADPEQYAKSFDDPLRDSWQMPARVIDVLKMSPETSVADIGRHWILHRAAGESGPARDGLRGRRRAVDARAHSQTRGRRTSPERRHRAGTDVSPNVPKPVDIVIVVDTYHHLPNRPAYFRELTKSLATHAHAKWLGG